MATKTIGAAGLKLIKKFEGCYLKAYKCPAGVWTIGYGHIEGVKPGQKITKAQADSMLKKDMIRYAKQTDAVTKHLKLNTNERDALISFCYNCGNGALKTLIKGRTKKQIADAMLLYNKGGGRVLRGLVRRRKAERKLFLTPVKTKTTTAKLKPMLAKKK